MLQLIGISRWSMEGLIRTRCLVAVSSVILAATPLLAEGGKPPITDQTQSSGGPLDPEQKKLRFDTGDLRIEVLPETETISGIATLNFSAKAPLKKLVIDLDRNLPVSAVSIDGKPLKSGAWANPEGRMTIQLGKTIAKGAAFTAEITYGGKPHVAVRAPWDGGFVWSKTKEGMPWVATAVQGEGCDLFWPCIDYPTYEPDRLDIHITVPKGLKAPSNGVFQGVTQLADGRTTWNWQVKQPTLYGVSLNIGPYEEISGTYKSRFGNEIPMFYWYLPGEEKQAKELFAEFAPTLDFFESVIGPYPFGNEKLGVVETPHLGMEHQTINAYGNAYKKSVEGFDWLFHHEFSHEWFANQLTVGNWDDFWLHEGTGSYMQPLYGEWREGTARYHAMMLTQRAGIVNKSAIVAGKPQSERQVYFDSPGRGGDIYTKGSWTLHSLRNLIGDKAFFDVVKLAVYGRTDPTPENIKPLYRSTPEFIGFVNQVTGTNYQWFFDVYLYQAALPELIEKREGNTLTLAWKTSANRPFPMPIEVSIDGAITRLAMTGSSDVLVVPAGAHVVIDPMSKVLRRSTAIEEFQAWRATQKPEEPKK